MPAANNSDRGGRLRPDADYGSADSTTAHAVRATALAHPARFGSRAARPAASIRSTSRAPFETRARRPNRSRTPAGVWQSSGARPDRPLHRDNPAGRPGCRQYAVISVPRVACAEVDKPWYTRVLTVLSGHFIRSAISWNVRPWYSFRMIACRCSAGSFSMAAATPRLSSARAARSSTVSVGCRAAGELLHLHPFRNGDERRAAVLPHPVAAEIERDPIQPRRELRVAFEAAAAPETRAGTFPA